MKIEMFTFNAFQENTYILWDETGACAILDPGMSNEAEDKMLFDFVGRNGLRPEIVLNTHCHIDHVLGNFSATEKYKIPLKYHRLEEKTLATAPAASLMWDLSYKTSPGASGYLDQNDIVIIGNSTLEIRFVPGHAPGHIAFIDHFSRLVLGGDVLFNGSVGRVDLPGCNADDLVNSIQQQLYSLPDDYIVYPGHGPATTIGSEKKNNPFVRAETSGF